MITPRFGITSILIMRYCWNINIIKHHQTSLNISETTQNSNPQTTLVAFFAIPASRRVMSRPRLVAAFQAPSQKAKEHGHEVHDHVA